MAADPARLERFTRETRAVAALNHPNIVTIHSTEEADGMRFFTMELVEGQTLDTVIPVGGLSVPRFLELAMPIADAVTAAHQKGITHRDLKPGNVIVASDARVKVLDFGLARIGESRINQNIDATRADLTHEGTIVGTMPYMSPEQIEGKPLDHRSDLFSLGVMYYEMLSGTRPFSGESSPLLMSSILKDLPRDLTDVRPEIPAALSRLFSRCVEKRVDDRVQTARDVYNELRHLQKQLESGASRGEASSSATLSSGLARARGLRIAVLPFTSRAGDDEAGVLAEGLTDDVTAGLSRFSYLSVVSRAALDQNMRAGARYLLEGNIRRAGNAVRIGVKLTDGIGRAPVGRELRPRSVLVQSSAHYVPLTQLAISAAAAGDREAAIAFAQRAWRDRELPFVMWARYYTGFESLRDDARFAAIIREMDEGA